MEVTLIAPMRDPDHAGENGFVEAPIAFHAEWPPVMYFASNPRSRNLMAVLHPT
jgi:hypothetical protein